MYRAQDLKKLTSTPRERRSKYHLKALERLRRRETKKESSNRGILTERSNTKRSARFAVSNSPTFCKTYRSSTAVINNRRIYVSRFILVWESYLQNAINEKKQGTALIAILALHFYYVFMLLSINTSKCLKSAAYMITFI